MKTWIIHSSASAQVVLVFPREAPGTTQQCVLCLLTAYSFFTVVPIVLKVGVEDCVHGNSCTPTQIHSNNWNCSLLNSVLIRLKGGRHQWLAQQADPFCGKGLLS